MPSPDDSEASLPLFKPFPLPEVLLFIPGAVRSSFQLHLRWHHFQGAFLDPSIEEASLSAGFLLRTCWFSQSQPGFEITRARDRSYAVQCFSHDGFSENVFWMVLVLGTPRNPKLALFGYETQWHPHVIMGAGTAIKKYKAWWVPFRSVLL